MDIRKFSVSPSARLVLRDASDEVMLTDDGKEIAVNLFGPGSKQFAKAQAQQQARLVKRMSTKGKGELSMEEKATESAEFLAACTDSWEHMQYEELAGDALSKVVYADRSIGFISDQVARFVNNWANFKPVSTAT